MRIVAVVPMKLNNVRLPQKNTKPFTNGMPLCWYILNTLLSINEIEKVYVYCSNPDIQSYIPENVTYLKRPEALDQDKTSMNEVLASFCNEVDADIYVMTHTTAPFISNISILKGLNAVLSNKYDSAFAVCKLQNFIWKDEMPFNYDLTNIPRTQDLPILYEETSGFYIYKKSVMLNEKRRIGSAPFLVLVDKIEAIDIDEEDDFYIADAIYNHKKNSST